MDAIKLGDKVKFVNEQMEGIVTSINGKIAGVTIDGDFELPVSIHELVKTGSSKNHVAKEETVEPVSTFKETGIYIAFERMAGTVMNLHLFNAGSNDLLYTITENKKLHYITTSTGKVIRGNGIIAGKYDLEQFSEWPVFIFQFLFITDQQESQPAPFTRTIRFHAKEFHAAFRHSFFLQKQAYLFRIDEQLPATDLHKLANRDFSEIMETRSLSILNPDLKPGREVDLHIEHLTAKPDELRAREMIDLQMNTFIKTFEMAHVHKMDKIIFIHGAGNHFLKNKIKNYLTRQKELVKKFQDADPLKYGNGATEVWFH